MEPLWSPAVATGRSRWQMGRPRKRLRQAKTVAVSCDRSPPRFHGKEGVDGSSPSEGLKKSLQNEGFTATLVAQAGDKGRTASEATPRVGRATPPSLTELPANNSLLLAG